MVDARVVARFQPVNELDERLSDRHVVALIYASVYDRAEQIATRAIVHDEVGVAWLQDNVVKLDHVGTVDGGRLV